MYCKNCRCAGCQKVPSISALRKELRTLRLRKVDMDAQVRRVDNDLRALLAQRRKAMVAKDAPERGVQPGLLVMEQSLDDLVRVASERVKTIQEAVDHAKVMADPVLQLRSLTDMEQVTKAAVEGVASSIQRARAVLPDLEAGLAKAKKDHAWQEAERNKYHWQKRQRDLAEQAVATHDQRKIELEGQLGTLCSELKSVEKQEVDVDEKIAEHVRQLRRFHAT